MAISPCLLKINFYRINIDYFVEFYHKVGILTKSFNKEEKRIYRGDFFIKQNTRNHIYFLKQIGGLFAYSFIFWLFFKNNIRFIINKQIRKNLSTWWLINKSYIEGVLIQVQVEHEGIIDFNNMGLQFKLMKREEQYQAIDFVSKLCSGDKIVYWTRGAKIHDPRKWFFKIELR